MSSSTAELSVAAKPSVPVPRTVVPSAGSSERGGTALLRVLVSRSFSGQLKTPCCKVSMQGKTLCTPHGKDVTESESFDDAFVFTAL